MPFLRFDFRSSTPGDTARARPPRRHLWDRQTGAYRLEMARPDSAIVALFNVNEARAGRVFVNGAPVADTAAARPQLDLTPPRADRAEIRAVYAAAW